MNFTIPCNGLPFSLTLAIRCKIPTQIGITAMDGYKANTCYIERKGVVNGYREFELQFPQSPQVMLLSVFNTNLGNNENADKSFEIVHFETKVLQTHPLWQDAAIHQFVEFAKSFCADASILSAGQYKPSIYKSNNAKFTIDYYDKILNKNTGQFVNTPARIGHATGIIEVSKSDFLRYTVPMRMIILLHEFSHKYMNPKIGRDIDDEVSADINACNIYLSLGYPTIEAEYAFAKVFRGADNESNRKRLIIIDDFIKKFNKGELQHKSVVNTTTKALV